MSSAASLDSTPNGDRSLIVRTLLAGLLAGAMGWGIANATVTILANIAVPSFDRYIQPTALAHEITALAAWSKSLSPRAAIILAWALTGLTALAFPLLFNRLYVSRKILSVRGLTKVIVTCAIVAILEWLVVGIAGGDTKTFPGENRSDDLSEHWATDLFWQAPLAGFGTALWFALAGELTLGGGPAQFFNRATTNRRVSLGALAGFVAGLVTAILAAWLAGKASFFQRAQFDVLSESAEVTRLAWDRAALGMGLSYGLLGFATAALTISLSPSRAGATRRAIAVSLPVLAGVALVLLVGWAETRCLVDFEMRHPDLKTAAGLEPEPKPRVMILPTKSGLKSFDYRMAVEVSGPMSFEMVGATEGNLAKVQSYLEARRGRWTAHTLKAWDALAAIRDRLLDVDGALQAMALGAITTNSLLWPQLLAHRISRMPLTPAVRDLGANLLEPSRYVARGIAKSRLARVAENLGAHERAKALWDEAKLEGFLPKKGVEPPSAKAPANRSLRGTVFIQGKAASGFRVALYEARAEGHKLAEVESRLALRGATTADADGRFLFENLGAQSFLLGVLLPERVTVARVNATGNAGPYRFSRESESKDLGAIRIDIER